MRILPLACALLAFSLAVPAGWSSDYFVATDGSDSNSGSSLASPFRTIQRGANALAAGDTLWVRAGTWRESVSITKTGTAAAPIVIAAYGTEHPVLKGSQVVTGWVRDSRPGVWKKTGWAWNSQQVFDDGVSLRQVGLISSHYASAEVDGTTRITPFGSGPNDLIPGSFCSVSSRRRCTCASPTVVIPTDR
jgi:hypothetical protein